MCSGYRLSVGHAEEVHGKVQRHVRHFPWDRALDEGRQMDETSMKKEAKQRWRFAADAARTIDEGAVREDWKHTSGVFFALENGLGSVVDKEEGAVESTPCNEGRIAFAWVNVRGGLRVFVENF